MILATRTRKARHQGWCILGNHNIQTGTRIGQFPSGHWACVTCINTHNSQGDDAA